MDKSILKALADNPLLLAVLKQTIEEKFSLDNLNHNLDNETLGQTVKARLEGLARMTEVYREINNYKSTPNEPPKINGAR